jgi:hypothetical protein
MQVKQATAKNWTIGVNRFLYGGGWILALIMAFALNDWGTAIANAGIALAFDPFQPDQPWKERPWYQKAWLIVHLGLVAAGFGWMLAQAM